MSTWEERMSQRAKARKWAEVMEKRKAYLGKAFLPFWPTDLDEGARKYGFEPMTDINIEIVAAHCLGITYGDPGPRLESNWCRQCWGDRHVWLGNAWGVQHVQPSLYPAPGRMHDCGHDCHRDELWLASAPNTANCEKRQI